MLMGHISMTIETRWDSKRRLLKVFCQEPFSWTTSQRILNYSQSLLSIAITPQRPTAKMIVALNNLDNQSANAQVRYIIYLIASMPEPVTHLALVIEDCYIRALLTAALYEHQLQVKVCITTSLEDGYRYIITPDAICRSSCHRLG